VAAGEPGSERAGLVWLDPAEPSPVEKDQMIAVMKDARQVSGLRLMAFSRVGAIVKMRGFLNESVNPVDGPVGRALGCGGPADRL